MSPKDIWSKEAAEADRSMLVERDGKLWWPTGYVPLWLRQHEARRTGQIPA